MQIVLSSNKYLWWLLLRKYSPTAIFQNRRLRGINSLSLVYSSVVHPHYNISSCVTAPRNCYWRSIIINGNCIQDQFHLVNSMHKLLVRENNEYKMKLAHLTTYFHIPREQVAAKPKLVTSSPEIFARAHAALTAVQIASQISVEDCWIPKNNITTSSNFLKMVLSSKNWGGGGVWFKILQ